MDEKTYPDYEEMQRWWNLGYGPKGAEDVKEAKQEGYSVEDLEDPCRVGVELEYPRNNPRNQVEIGLTSVRAADSILVSYDFTRDGWSIKQASRFSWDIDESPDPDWQEVAFIQAWAREVDRDDDD